MEKQNILTAKAYTLVFLGLVILTLVSTGLSSFNLGYLNELIAIVVAIVSAGAVLSQFMRVKLDGGFARLLLAGVLALALLIFFVAFVG
ncbi:hypothetical protein [Carboxylicivirga taeanensis]|uniref:hypothetical protein n=1 Tax=Carboxylicivirga taeanensis TaxID=1416875 RepID=UPI003F6E379A